MRTSLILLVLLGIVPFIGGNFFAYQLSLFLIYAIVVQGIGYIWSKTQIIPLGQSFFFGIGAYLGAYILKNFDLPVLQFGLFIAVVAGMGLVGFGLTAVIFKGRANTGPFFSLITLALVMIAEQIANSASSITGGFNGYSGYDSFLGIDPFGNFYFVAVIACVGVCYLLLWLDKRPFGLLATAISDNEPRLQLLGFPTHLIKACVFALSAMLAAFAGILFATYQGIVTPSSIGFLLAAEFVIWSAVGGRFHPTGAIIGTVLIGIASTNLRDHIEGWDIILALGFIFVVVKAPAGLYGLLMMALPAQLMMQLMTKIAVLLRVKPPSPQTAIAAPALHHQGGKSSLTVHNATLKIGTVSILNGLSFQTPESGIIALIGPNGAGKTSVFNVITGNLHLNAGSITYGGRRIENLAPFHALSNGIGRKLQVPTIFSTLTIRDNLAIAHFAGRMRLFDYFRHDALWWKSAWCRHLAQHPHYEFLAKEQEKAGELSQGHRQFLEFMMATISEPRLLLLDEPGAGLSHNETMAMSALIRDVATHHDCLIVLIEHDISIVESISDQIIVMHLGHILAYGNYHEIRNNPQVKAVYVGDSKG